MHDSSSFIQTTFCGAIQCLLSTTVSIVKSCWLKYANDALICILFITNEIVYQFIDQIYFLIFGSI